jgi:hypothetical protein
MFDGALERLEKNLQYFKDDKYKKMQTEIDFDGITKKYKVKLSKFDTEINKLN